MDIPALASMFEALASPTRITILQLLARHRQGLPAGVIAESLQVKRSTLSAHLRHLERLGLLLSHRSGKLVIYTLEEQRLKRFLTAGASAVLNQGP